MGANEKLHAALHNLGGPDNPASQELSDAMKTVGGRMAALRSLHPFGAVVGEHELRRAMLKEVVDARARAVGDTEELDKCTETSPCPAQLHYPWCQAVR